jgi:hypothetical protein
MGVNQRHPQMQQALADGRRTSGAHCEAIVARWNAAPTQNRDEGVYSAFFKSLWTAQGHHGAQGGTRVDRDLLPQSRMPS